MPHRLETYLPQMIEAVKNGGLMLITDLDGALISRPPAVHNPIPSDPFLEKALCALQLNGNNVAINTGRPHIFPLNLFPCASKDMWIVTETGAHIVAPGSLSPIFKSAVEGHEDLVKILRAELKGIKGAVVEDYKSCAITISLAAMENAQEQARLYNHMQHFISNKVQGSADIIPVHKPGIDTYIEIIPRGIHKGTGTDFVFERIMRQGDLAICFGDTNADQTMMAAVNSRGGISFGVGDKAPDNSVVRLDTVQTARDLVGMLASESTRAYRERALNLG